MTEEDESKLASNLCTSFDGWYTTHIIGMHSADADSVNDEEIGDVTLAAVLVL